MSSNVWGHIQTNVTGRTHFQGNQPHSQLFDESEVFKTAHTVANSNSVQCTERPRYSQAQ